MGLMRNKEKYKKLQKNLGEKIKKLEEFTEILEEFKEVFNILGTIFYKFR